MRTYARDAGTKTKDGGDGGGGTGMGRRHGKQPRSSERAADDDDERGEKRRRGVDGVGSPFPVNTDLVGAFFSKHRHLTGVPEWRVTNTYVRELRRLGFDLSRSDDGGGRLPKLPPYLDPPEGVIGARAFVQQCAPPRTRLKCSRKPEPDLNDVNSDLKYFVVLDGLHGMNVGDRGNLEGGGKAMLDKCRALNASSSSSLKANSRVVALWVVSRLAPVKARRYGEVPDMQRHPRLRSEITFTQPPISAFMAQDESLNSPLHGLNTDRGTVVDVRTSGGPSGIGGDAVCCAFLRFDVIKGSKSAGTVAPAPPRGAAAAASATPAVANTTKISLRALMSC